MGCCWNIFHYEFLKEDKLFMQVGSVFTCLINIRMQTAWGEYLGEYLLVEAGRQVAPENKKENNLKQNIQKQQLNINLFSKWGRLDVQQLKEAVSNLNTGE